MKMTHENDSWKFDFLIKKKSVGQKNKPHCNWKV